MARKKFGFVEQEFRNAEFHEVVSHLLALYCSKNLKYGDSFDLFHKSYKEAHYNIRRKYARLERMANGLQKKMTDSQGRALMFELSDMAVYSIMCMMKFKPEKFDLSELWEKV